MLIGALLAAAIVAGPLPEPRLTPGWVDGRATAESVCSTRWGHNRRHVTAKMRRAVFAAYGMSGNTDPLCHPQGCELDHLISRELGGADDVRNLWPQPIAGAWGAKIKDRLENRLHLEVCQGRLSLDEAQRMESKDWVAAYASFWPQ